MAERVKFPGDPEIKETGTGQGPDIPLSRTIAPTTVEMLDQKKGDDEDQEETRSVAKGKLSRAQKPAATDDDSEDDDDNDDGPGYSRENIGARIGLPLEEMQRVNAAASELDQDDVVACLFPHKVMLQDKGIMHSWEAGTHLVPVSIAGRTPKERHFYLKHHKVKHVGKPMKNPDADSGRVEEDEDAA
jgi:hypothetical protein